MDSRPSAEEDIDALLRLQDEFLAKKEASSASVKRVRPKENGPGKKNSTAMQPSTKHTGGIASNISGILGDVLERVSEEPQELIPCEKQASFPIASHRGGSKFSLSRPRIDSTATSGPPSQPAAKTESESDSVLQEMSPAEIASAVDELKTRLSPATLEFLRKRGQSKIDGSHSVQSGVKDPQQVPTDQDAKWPSGEADGIMVADPRLVARLRFSLHAEVVDIQPDGEKSSQDQVLLRDALRSDMGLVPEGYTITEILILARSSLPNHRALAMRMLADVLTMSRPSAFGILNSVDKQMSELVSIPDSPKALGRRVYWHEVWQYAVHDLPVTPHIRLALDDDHAQVVTAAAFALAALLCPSFHDSIEIEAAECCSSTTGWPMCARECYLQRPDATGVWEEQSVTPPPDRTPGVAANEGAPQSPEDVSAIDPCLGLIQMQVLQRIRYLLEVKKPPGSFEPLLASLASLARASEAVSLLVVKCPRMLEALKSFLVINEDSGISTSPQVSVLFLARTLCQMSHIAAQLMRSAGFFPLIQAHLLTACKMLHPSSGIKEGSGESKILMQVCLIETIRLWKACAHQGAAGGMPCLEDVFSSLCYLFVSPPSLHATSMDWQVCREAHLLVSSLMNHALAVESGDKTLGQPMLGPGTAAAIVKDVAHQWLDSLDQRAIHMQISSMPTDLNEARSKKSTHGPTSCWTSHPSTKISVCFASSTCLSAALALLSTYWSSVRYDKVVFEEIAQKMKKCGLNENEESSMPLIKRCSDRILGVEETDALGEMSAASILYSLLSLWKHVFVNDLGPGSSLPFLPRLALASSSEGLIRRAYQLDARSTKLGKQVASPWYFITLQRMQHFTRLFLLAVKISGKFSYEHNTSQGEGSATLQLCSLVTKACFSIPNVTPPGWECEAFFALSCALAPSSLWKESHAPASHLLLHTFSDLEQVLLAGWPKLTKVTLSSSIRDLTDDSLLSSYPCPSIRSLTDADRIGGTLLKSYSASWLSLLQVDDYEGNSPSRKSPCESSPSDSRLPAPPLWHLMEAHDLPGFEFDPVGCALALSLSMDITLSRFEDVTLRMEGNSQLDVIAKVRWAIHSTCFFDKRNLLCEVSDGLGSWRDPLTRWSLFGMFVILGNNMAGFEWCTPRMAEKITQLYTSSTFGDPWFGSFLISPLLQPKCPEVIRMATLNALSESGNSLLLPSRDFCFK